MTPHCKKWGAYLYSDGARPRTRMGMIIMIWTRPKLREICIGMEINGYLPAEL